MTKKTKTTLTIAAGGIILVALALPRIVSSDGPEASSGPGGVSRDQRIRVNINVIRPQKISDRAVTVGTILSNEEVEIRSEVSGKIEKIFFTEGGRVAGGEPLVKINDAELQAQLLHAQARESLARQQEERQRQLYEKTLVSRQEYDNARTNLDVARAEVQLVNAQLNKTVIRASFDGSIGLRYISEGSYVTPAVLITTLQDKGTVKIDFSVPEKYAVEITPGDRIAFTVQGIPRSFRGTIYALDPKIDPKTRTLRLRASSPNRDGLLIPGSLASVEISFREKQAFMIPAFALIPGLKGHSVFLYRNGRAESRSVAIGTRTDELVEITEGLQSGDTLIISAILQLRPGAEVIIAGGDAASEGRERTGTRK